jgi:DNA-damage-inducible protein J
LRQAVRTGGFPFEIKVDQPNQETLLALLESERIAQDPDAVGYTNIEDVLRKLKQ